MICVLRSPLEDARSLRKHFGQYFAVCSEKPALRGDEQGEYNEEDRERKSCKSHQQWHYNNSIPFSLKINICSWAEHNREHLLILTERKWDRWWCLFTPCSNNGSMQRQIKLFRFIHSAESPRTLDSIISESYRGFVWTAV